MLSIPLKSTQNVVLTKPITNYIKSKYGKPEASNQASAIATVQQMRSDAFGARTANDANKSTLRRYVATIDAIRDKIPISHGGSIRVNFVWFPAFRPQKYAKYMSWEYERACVLWNLASLESKTGCTHNRQSAEGVKAAAAAFSSAAGMFKMLRDKYMSGVAAAGDPDFAVGPLDFCIHLCQAQAQACYYEKAKASNMKPSILAKLAHQAADLFRSAREDLKKGDMARLVSPAQGWSSFCQFQYNCLVATANLMQSRDALAKAEKAAKGYGVEIAYLTAARQFASAALTTAKDKNCRVNPSDVAGLLAAINARLQQATDDNNHIYIEAVPSAKALPSIGMILMAKPTEPEEFSKTETVPPLFSSLVPPEITAGAQEFTQVMQAMAASRRGDAMKRVETAKARLQALGLPGAVEAGDSASGVPDAMWNKIQMVQSQGGAKMLEEFIQRNSRTAAAVRELLNQSEAALMKEAAEDDAKRRQFGSAYTCTPSAALNSKMIEEVSRFKGLLGPAAASDQQVSATFQGAKAALVNLARPRNELDQQVPSSTATGVGEAERVLLSNSLRALNDLFAARESLLEAYTKACAHVDITNDLFKAGISEKEAVFERAKGKVSSESKAIDTNLDEQDELMSTIDTQNELFVAARSTDTSNKKREEALQRLQSAVDAFQKLHHELKEGEHFYGDLKQHVQRLAGDVQGHVAARNIERHEEVLRLTNEGAAQSTTQADEEFARRLQAQEQAAAGGAGAGGGAGAAAPPALAAPAYTSIGGGYGAVAAPTATPYAPPAAVAAAAYGAARGAPPPTYAPPASVAGAPSPAYAAPAASYAGPAYGGAAPTYAAPAPAAPAYGYGAPVQQGYAQPAYTATPVGGPHGAPPRGPPTYQ